MPRLSANECYIRNLSEKLSEMLNLPYEVVRSVIDGIHLSILNDIREQGRTDMQNGEVNKITIELPNVGTLILSPMKYTPKKDSILDGQALKPKFIIREKFLLDCRYAYYDQRDYLSEVLIENFQNLFSNHYSSIMKFGDKEDCCIDTDEFILDRIEELFDRDNDTYYIYIKDILKDPVIKKCDCDTKRIANIASKSKRFVIGIGHKSEMPYLLLNSKRYIDIAKSEGDRIVERKKKEGETHE